jgi:hypothetical protein
VNNTDLSTMSNADLSAELHNTSVYIRDGRATIRRLKAELAEVEAELARECEWQSKLVAAAKAAGFASERIDFCIRGAKALAGTANQLLQK